MYEVPSKIRSLLYWEYYVNELKNKKTRYSTPAFSRLYFFDNNFIEKNSWYIL